MAVQLARLSLWLATLSANKPLSFLDHHLVAGNSLVGASPEDVRRQPPGSGTAWKTSRATSGCASTVRWRGPVRDDAGSVEVRKRLASEADDSAEVVRAKERTLAALTAPDGGSRTLVTSRRFLVRRMVLGAGCRAGPSSVRRAAGAPPRWTSPAARSLSGAAPRTCRRGGGASSLSPLAAHVSGGVLRR